MRRESAEDSGMMRSESVRTQTQVDLSSIFQSREAAGSTPPSAQPGGSTVMGDPNQEGRGGDSGVVFDPWGGRSSWWGRPWEASNNSTSGAESSTRAAADALASSAEVVEIDIGGNRQHNQRGWSWSVHDYKTGDGQRNDWSGWSWSKWTTQGPKWTSNDWSAGDQDRWSEQNWWSGYYGRE